MKRLAGRGLHGGRESAVVLTPCEGATTLGRGDDRAALGELRIEGRDRCSVAVLPSGAELSLVEHLLSAVAGAHAFSGVHIEVEGDELPLLDGAAAMFFDAMVELACESAPFRVVRAAEIEAHGTVLRVEPGESIDVAVEVSFEAARFGRALSGVARWTGDRSQYRAEIATARTFGAARELEALRARGLAAHLPEGAVVALDLDDDPRFAPRDPEEPIRHKLLDALGDLAALGGPLYGHVRIVRPSHRGTRAAIERARQMGVLVRG